MRFAGVGHSPSDLACTADFMLRTVKMNKVLEVSSRICVISLYWMLKCILQVDTEKQWVIAQGGIVLNDLNEELSRLGLALSNLGSISDQTLGGAITTATHGSGVHYGVLSTQVLELTLMLADGSVTTCSSSERSSLFNASLCGLGATGLILSVKLQVEPSFNLKEDQKTYNFDDLVDTLDEIAHSGEHVRFWWFAQTGKIRLSICNRTAEVQSLYFTRHLYVSTDSVTGFSSCRQLAVALFGRLPFHPIYVIRRKVFAIFQYLGWTPCGVVDQQRHHRSRY